MAVSVLHAAFLLLIGIGLVAGFQVSLYSEPGFQGQRKDVTIDRSCISIVEDFNDETSAVNSQGNCVMLYDHVNCVGNKIRIAPGTPSHSDLRPLNFDNRASSIGPCYNEEEDRNKPPPAEIREHWGESNGFVVKHGATLYLQQYNDDIAVYFDIGVRQGTNWMFDYMTKVWRYTKSAYGPFGKGRFWAIYHAGNRAIQSDGMVCQPSTYLSGAIEHKDALDCISSDADGWSQGTPLERDMSVHEIAHVVESAFAGVRESPAFEIWQDSKWAEIFQYDVYKNAIGEEEARRWYDQMMDPNRDLSGEHLQYGKYPAPGTHWFKNFFYPIYQRYGGSRVLRSFFQTLVEYFPRKPDDRDEYARRMNMGEFVHFWSGAAGQNVKPYIERTFNWNRYPEFEQQLTQAKRDFPLIRYTPER